MKKVGIVMGSDSDLPILRKAMDMLDTLGVPYETHIYSAHRTPVEARDFALNARVNNFGCIIAAAGMAAHLAGAIAANTTLPVIGIPCKGGMMDGLDACSPLCRCPPVSPWPPWPSTAVSTPRCWLPRSSPSPSLSWPPSWTPSAPPMLPPSSRRTLPSRQS